MGQSASKRVKLTARPKNKKNSLKVANRTKNNYIVLENTK